MPTISIALKDQRKDGTFNLKVLIVHNQKPAFIKTDYYLKKNQLRNGRVVNHPNANIINRRVQSVISDYENKIDAEWAKVDSMTVLEIKAFLLTKKVNLKVDFFEYLDGVIGDLRDRYAAKLAMDGKASKRTYENYQVLRNRLGAFAGQSLPVQKINLSFIRKFEAYLRSQGVNSGIWNYMKDLRTIINMLIREDILTEYPFRHYNVGKLKKQAEPKTIENDTLKKLIDYVPENENQQLAKNVFLLDFYLIGVNPVDLYHLENGGGRMENGRIFFDRSKTDVIHSIMIEPESAKIIEQIRGAGHYFIFQDQYIDTANFTRGINKQLKAICVNLEVPKFTLGAARYTWATVAFNDCDVPESVIDFALGHKSKTLAGAHYIKKRRNLMDDANRKVIDFVVNL